MAWRRHSNILSGEPFRTLLRNIFLGGNTFSESHSVDENLFVGDLQPGLVDQGNHFRLTYNQIFRTKDFEGQQGGDIFGALSLSYHF